MATRGKTIRTITDEQFSEGTSIDGARIDAALQDLRARFNRLHQGDIGTRFVQNQYSFGWQPQIYDASEVIWPSPGPQGATRLDHIFPWMPVRNSKNGTAGMAANEKNFWVQPPPDHLPLNEVRFKGIAVPNLEEGNKRFDSDIEAQYAWTTSFQASFPRILNTIFVILRVDQASLGGAGRWYQNDFDSDSGLTLAEAGDWSVQVAVDAPYGRPYDTSKRTVVFNANLLYRFPLTITPDLSATGHPAFGDDFNTNIPLPGGALEGLCLWRTGLNIPLFEGAKVRVSVILPRWDTASRGWTENTRLGSSPHHQAALMNQAYDLTVTFLDPLVGSTQKLAGHKAQHIDAKGISRGVFLNSDHLEDPVVTGAASLLEGNVGADQLERDRAVFSVPVWMPFICSRYIESKKDATVAPEPDLRFGPVRPLVIPPLQEFFNADGVAAQGAVVPPRVELNEVTVSWDHRDEPAGTADQVYASAAGGVSLAVDKSTASYCGGLIYTSFSWSSLEVVLYAKKQGIFDKSVYADPNGAIPAGSNIMHRPSEVVWRGRVDHSGGTFSLPLMFSGLSITLDQYKTYVVALYADDLFLTEHPVHGSEFASVVRSSLVNVLVDFKMSHDLVARDAGSDIQNIPAQYDGAIDGPTIGAVAPSAGDIITAEGDGGVSETLQKVDEFLGRRLRGGYTWWGGPEHNDGNSLSEDAAYHVLPVVLWGNQPMGEFNVHNAHLVPYIPPTPDAGPTADARRVPLDFPITIHHVIACMNRQTMLRQVGRDATDLKTTHKIGVSLGSGIRHDAAANTTVAYLDVFYDDATLAVYRQHLIDRIMVPQAPENVRFPEWDILQVPIVRQSAVSGAGYPYTASRAVINGKPFYAGRSLGSVAGGPTEVRRNCGNIANGSISPPTAGAEQFLDVRWSIETDGTAFDDAAMGTDAVYAGYGGHIVYIVYKKHLV